MGNRWRSSEGSGTASLVREALLQEGGEWGEGVGWEAEWAITQLQSQYRESPSITRTGTDQWAPGRALNVVVLSKCFWRWEVESAVCGDDELPGKSGQGTISPPEQTSRWLPWCPVGPRRTPNLGLSSCKGFHGYSEDWWRNYGRRPFSGGSPSPPF